MEKKEISTRKLFIYRFSIDSMKKNNTVGKNTVSLFKFLSKIEWLTFLHWDICKKEIKIELEIC